MSPEENVEVRQLSITNLSSTPRRLDVTSFYELALAPQAADVAHPAFSNLFVQTEFVPNLNTLLATRRPRSAKDKPIWLAQVIVLGRNCESEVQYETDRSKFIGRGRSSRNPISITNGDALSNTVGSVLDPSLSLRAHVSLDKGGVTLVTFATICAESREDILNLAEQFQLKTTLERAASQAWTQSQVQLHYLNIEPDEAHLFQRLATRLLFSDPSLRPASELIKLNTKDVTGLWAQGISGDFPILLVRIDDLEDRGLVRQLLKAHEYLGTKHLKFDLVILNEKANSYAQELQDTLTAMVHAATVVSHSALSTTRGKVFVLRGDLLSEQDRLVIYAMSRVSISARQGSLSDQVRRTLPKSDYPVRARRAVRDFDRNRKVSSGAVLSSRLPDPALEYGNGIGGFDERASEYVITLADNISTPAPWLNVISKPDFGFQVSETGSGFTWSMNSRENQLTPWSNDPVCDPAGEALYIKDINSGDVWTPTALPIRIPGALYTAHHGQGYSRFVHLSNGIHSELTQFVAPHVSVKMSVLHLRNESRELRQLSVTGYVEWVLGFSRSTMAPTTVTEFDAISQAVFASNARSDEYGSRISFASFDLEPNSYTCDRTEFIGRNGCLEAPASLYRKTALKRAAGAGLDPCAALEVSLEIPPGESVEVVFYLGQAASRAQARDMIADLRHPSQTPTQLLKQTREEWQSILGKITVQTPDKAMDLMLNKWLLYQTLACRFWARAGFYQVGGAFGFRDQLQDQLALVTSQPEMAREHILRAAARQFPEGDVQHWWHPPFGRGVRTHFSDDLIWLPYTVSHYLNVTDDHAILDQQIPFIDGPLLRPDQEDSYFTPSITRYTESLYEHCARSLDKSLAVGAHGLPLIGAGDWNDGMNRVGHDGKGESVWLAWFLFLNLKQFAEPAQLRGQVARAETWLLHAEALRKAIEETAWDGEWYRRAYFDDGTPIGSASQDECKIDSLAQTWAVISGAGDPQRALESMSSIDEWLVKEKDRMILLFTPPFDKTPMDPGYIKGYLPGVRENGGQYTHAAVWTVVANAMLGRGQRAYDLFKMLNPVFHATTPEDVQRYKVEPYVLAADVYSVAPYTGRGGWTWYTGSSGWMYRAGIEYILGIKLRGARLFVEPCIPPEWPGFSAIYKHGLATYKIEVSNPRNSGRGVTALAIDGVAQPPEEGIELVDFQSEHNVVIVIG